jgi:hypothetical protein
MPKVDPQQNRYYPSPTKTKDLHNDFRLLFDHVYSLQDRLKETQGQLATMTKKHSDLASQVANGPSTTKIGGLFVKAMTPNDGDRLTYDGASGQIVYKP